MPSAVILTAIPVEYNAVRKYLNNPQKEKDPSGRIYKRGDFKGWDVRIAEVGAGNTRAALGTRDAIAHFNPNVILFVGVAAGIKDLVLGDVVVATKVYYYEFWRVEETDSARRPEVSNVDSQLIELAKDEANESDWRTRLKTAPSQSPKVIVKPIASGEKLIASTKSIEYQRLRDQYNDAIAVEMEGHGFLTAVNDSVWRVPALVIRGISDLIDDKEKTDKLGYPEIAADHASAFAFQILAKHQLTSTNPVPNIWKSFTNLFKGVDETLTKQNPITESAPKFTFDVVTINRERREAEYFTEKLTQGVILEMVAIPSGTFTMGSPKEEAESRDNERPQHRVTVKSFYMGKYAVTQAQWQAVARLPQINCELKPDPSNFKGNNRPVERISWYDAVEFCDRLSKATGRNYRLPSEAEWEYACRGGTSTPFHFGKTITPELANYDGNYTYGAGAKGEYPKQTTAVGSFKVANAFGLYDMHGNVWEWCADEWHGGYQGTPIDGSSWFDDNNKNLYLRQGRAVLRGGSWDDIPKNCRSASRHFNDRAERDFHVSNVGFRVVCAFG